MTLFGSATQRVRPIRLAFLIEPRNKSHLRQAIRIASSVWGGAYCPIIPVYKRMPKSWREDFIKPPAAEVVVGGYVDAFDPDVLVQFSPELPSYLKDRGIEIARPDEIWEGLQQKRTAPKYAIGVFEILNDVFDKAFKFKRKYPLRIIVPKLPREHELFWASVLGEFPSAIDPILRNGFYEPLEIADTQFEPDRIAEMLEGHTLFPRRLTQYGLKSSNRSWRREAHGLFLDASDFDDIIDYWNLRAVGGSVIPIPKQLAQSTSYRAFVEDFLREHRIPLQNSPGFTEHANIVRSRSSSMDELEAFAKTLQLKPDEGGPKGAFYSLQQGYPRIWDEWAREKDSVAPADFYEDEESLEIKEGDDAKFLLKPKLPAFAQKHAYHGGWRCANDVSFRVFGACEPLAEVFPKSSGKKFLRAVGGQYRMPDEWRIGRRGVVRLVKNEVPDTWEVPAAENVFFAWLEDRGWKPELSTPGRLGKQIYRQLEGYPGSLRDEKLLGVLEHMNGGTVRSNGEPVEVNRIGQQRELSVGELVTRLKNENETGERTIKYLSNKRVFRVGLTIQCPQCTRRSWHAVATLGNTLTCPLCLNDFASIGNVESGTWAYKTVGPFSVPRYGDGAFATLLALDFFHSRHMSTLQSTPTFSFTAKGSDKTDLEADLALFWQESMYGEQIDGVLFGECKSYGPFSEADYKRMRYFAQQFPGAVLAFVTLRKTLTGGERKAIARIAKAGRTWWKSERPINPVLVLTARELLSDMPPPYCWKDSDTEKRFDQTHGLLAICNVTQQLYLGLPPWEDDWRTKAEARTKRKGRSGQTGTAE